MRIKTKRQRIEGYKSAFRNAGPEERSQFLKRIEYHAHHDWFRNQKIIDMCNAAQEVLAE